MHSFIEPNNLPLQAVDDKYGPVKDFETTKFRPTSVFQLTAVAKAFAVVAGQVIVQQQTSGPTGLVNIILKPTDTVKVGFTAVKYFIYRGIKKEKLVKTVGSAEVITPEGETDVDFIKRVWSDHTKRKIASGDSGLPDPTPAIFGYDTSLAGSIKVDELFANLHAVASYTVDEGMWIGDFTNDAGKKIGFEIVLEEGEFNPTLAELRGAEYVITLPSAADTFDNRMLREDIHRFIDPAAFYGHYYDGGTVGGTTDAADLYTRLIGKFSTRDRVYIDIRNEIGYSYDFYRNFAGVIPEVDHDKQLRITERGGAQSPVSYQTNLWPFVYIESAQPAGTKNEVTLELRTGDNGRPLLFLAHASFKTGSPLVPEGFLEGTDLLATSGAAWTKPLTFEFPNTGSGATRSNVANYIRLHLFRQSDPFVSYKPGVLKTEGYSDNLFGPIDHPVFVDLNDKFKFGYVHDLKYTNGTLPGVADWFGYVAERGGAYDNTRVICFVRSLRPFHITATRHGSGLGVSIARLNLDNSFFNLSTLSTEIKLSIDALQVPIGGGNYDKIPAIVMQDGTGTAKWIENLFLLCITRTQLDALRSATGFYVHPDGVHRHYRYIRPVQQGGALTDKDGKTYYKYELRVHGLSNASTPDDYLSGATGIFVYSRDGIALASKEFSGTLSFPLVYTRNYEEKMGEQKKQEQIKVPISALDSSARTFTISGRDVRKELLPGDKFTVVDSSVAANNKTYTVESVAFSGGSSLITVVSTDTITSGGTPGNIQYSDLTWEDYFIGRDTSGVVGGTTDTMSTIVSQFIAAIAAVPNNSSAKGALTAHVNTYAPKILARERALASEKYNYTFVDDRILYWARIKMEVALKGHPYLLQSPADSEELVRLFEELSRGYTTVSFTPGLKKILVTGFDPFELDSIRGNVEQSNPSGAVASALHGRVIKKNGVDWGHIQTMIFPVRYGDFDGTHADQPYFAVEGTGVVEKYIGPYIDNPALRADMIVTCSQALDHIYHIDRFATRMRGGGGENMGHSRKAYSPLISVPDASYNWIETALPPEFMPEHDYSQASVPPVDPAGDPNPDANGLWVLFDQSFIVAPDYIVGGYYRHRPGRDEQGPSDTDKTDYGRAKNHPSSSIVMKRKPVPPAGAALFQGSGGNYLSNEIFYRVALMRELLVARSGPRIPTGHFHLPKLQNDSVPNYVMADMVKLVKKVLERIEAGARALP